MKRMSEEKLNQMAKPGALVDKSYEESWEYIKSGNRSLEPHTNINF